MRAGSEERKDYEQKNSKNHLLLRNQIVTVVERFVLERQVQSLKQKLDQSQTNEIAIGQRVYYRGKFLGKVRHFRLKFKLREVSRSAMSLSAERRRKSMLGKLLKSQVYRK